MTYSVFIVDDEPAARANVLDAIRQHREWQCTRAFSSATGLLDAVRDEQPDVVFLDIQMPGQDGLTIARSLLTLPSPPLIVFITAYANYAVTAFELYAIDYLLKPFDDVRMAQCLEKLSLSLASSTARISSLKRQNQWAQKTPLETLIVRSSGALRIIPVDSIFWLAANGNYVDIHHSDGKHLLRGTLKNVFSYLDPECFIQIHRGVVVKTQLIREVKTVDEERCTLQLSNGHSLPVGKSYRAALIHRLCDGIPP